MTGIPAASQTLLLQRTVFQTASIGGTSTGSSYELSEGETIAALSDDSKTLSEYGVDKHGYIIKVGAIGIKEARYTPQPFHSYMKREQVNSNSALSNALYGFVEDSNVVKFELTDDEYASRKGDE